jgi:hypothetical protein
VSMLLIATLWTMFRRSSEQVRKNKRRTGRD